MLDSRARGHFASLDNEQQRFFMLEQSSRISLVRIIVTIPEKPSRFEFLCYSDSLLGESNLVLYSRIRGHLERRLCWRILEVLRFELSFISTLGYNH